jgi:hypothetical protein
VKSTTPFSDPKSSWPCRPSPGRLSNSSQAAASCGSIKSILDYLFSLSSTWHQNQGNLACGQGFQFIKMFYSPTSKQEASTIFQVFAPSTQQAYASTTTPTSDCINYVMHCEYSSPDRTGSTPTMSCAATTRLAETPVLACLYRAPGRMVSLLSLLSSCTGSTSTTPRLLAPG